jgi:hypothetical protein
MRLIALSLAGAGHPERKRRVSFASPRPLQIHTGFFDYAQNDSGGVKA